MFSRSRKKGKGPSSSSGRGDPPPRKKHQSKRTIRDESSEEEEESAEEMSEGEAQQMEQDMQRSEKPEWNKRIPLSQFTDRRWQPILYREKLEKLKSIDNVLVCERAVLLTEFNELGLVEKFENLGWEAVLTFHNRGLPEIHKESIVEWMATLQKIPGRNPPRTTQLKGMVNGTEVIMSFDTMRRIANFDSKPSNLYVYPPDNHLLGDSHDPRIVEIMQALFVPGKEGDCERNALDILPKLMAIIMSYNVIPRLGDRMKVRHYELKVLHALFSGEPMYSFRHLVMCNIWESRESLDRRMIPHCRLLTAMMIQQRAVNTNSPTIKKPHLFFTIGKLSSGEWQYEKTERYITLRDEKTGRRLRVLRGDAPEAEEGDEEEENQEDEATQVPPGRQFSEGGAPGWFSNYSAGDYSFGFAEPDNMGERIRSARPNEYTEWPRIAQLNWDRNTRAMENQERRMKGLYDQNQFYARMQSYNHELEINNRYRDAEEERHYHDWNHGLPYTVHPPTVDWENVTPYDGTQQRYPYPETHHSEWVPVNPPSAPEQGSSEGASEAFNLDQMRNSLMEQWFGPAQPPYQ